MPRDLASRNVQLGIVSHVLREQHVLRDLTLDLCLSNVLPAVATPRSLDLAHLRTALWFHTAEAIDRFLTIDASQEGGCEGAWPALCDLKIWYDPEVDFLTMSTPDPSGAYSQGGQQS